MGKFIWVKLHTLGDKRFQHFCGGRASGQQAHWEVGVGWGLKLVVMFGYILSGDLDKCLDQKLNIGGRRSCWNGWGEKVLSSCPKPSVSLYLVLFIQAVYNFTFLRLKKNWFTLHAAGFDMLIYSQHNGSKMHWKAVYDSSKKVK